MAYPTNLTEFRYWLKKPGATLVLIDAGKFATQWPAASLAAAMRGRQVEHTQSNAFTLKSGNPDRPNPSWLYFGKASDWRFDGELVTHLDDGNPMTYRMEILAP